MPILQNLAARQCDPLKSLRGCDIWPVLQERRLYLRGNQLLQIMGMAFRRFCKEKGVEKPPAHWDLRLIGRGEHDDKNMCPTMSTQIKAAHMKPILFFLSEVAGDINRYCNCACSKSLHVMSFAFDPRFWVL